MPGQTKLSPQILQRARFPSPAQSRNAGELIGGRCASRGTTHEKRSRNDIRAKRWVIGFGIVIFGVFCLNPMLNPSYSIRPSWYTGTNVYQEKIFIAANIVDAHLIRGQWGLQLLQLIALLGHENVFLSIYENDSGPTTTAALDELRGKLTCRHSIVSGHIDLETFPSFQILPGERRIKRIEYLSEVRNKAIEPLSNNATGMTFRKLLFLNDVIFSPHDAVDLLFATNAGHYRAACAMDFINAFKFYDTFATRDSSGYALGVPFFPWFAKVGNGASRIDVLAGTDAVRVQSCWGGMVVFEAGWFVRGMTEHRNDSTARVLPVRFRASDEIYWEASECCLVHADIAAKVGDWDSGRSMDIGVYVNPFIRVAYDARSYSWLGFVRYYERLFVLAHNWVNWVARVPTSQPRRSILPGQIFQSKEWVYDGPTPNDGSKTKQQKTAGITQVQKYGHWSSFQRFAKPGGFCGSQYLLALKKQWQPGEKMWEKIPAPLGSDD